MSYLKQIFIRRKAWGAAVMAVAVQMLSSCGCVFEDLEPCVAGVEMRFVYDYNLESANAFHSQVDCLTLHIYDADGMFVNTQSVVGAELADENWRMSLDLQPGDYHAIAYGGTACQAASFAHLYEPSSGSHYRDISMQLLTSHIGTSLHDHFHGRVDFTVPADLNGRVSVTLPMTKTTNHFRILLQNLDGSSVDGDDFEFTIIDSNRVLDYTNTPMFDEKVIYPAWETGSVSTTDVESRAADVTLGYAELSTSRLMMGTGAHLVIRHKESGREVADLPLTTYLVMSKSAADPWSNQEYLDRCSRWNLTFFLEQGSVWSMTRIIINGWSVRINDSDF